MFLQENVYIINNLTRLLRSASASNASGRFLGNYGLFSVSIGRLRYLSNCGSDSLIVD